jgi:phosphoribosylcarboxyaminoimidazole (NCAIR) mutase
MKTLREYIDLIKELAGDGMGEWEKIAGVPGGSALNAIKSNTAKNLVGAGITADKVTGLAKKLVGQKAIDAVADAGGALADLPGIKGALGSVMPVYEEDPEDLNSPGRLKKLSGIKSK